MPAYEDALAYFLTFTCHGTWLHGTSGDRFNDAGPPMSWSWRQTHSGSFRPPGA